MKKFTMLALALMVSAPALAADSLSVSKDGNNKTVSLAGRQGQAEELFNLFKNAGVASSRHIEGTEYEGKTMIASAFFLPAKGMSFGWQVTAPAANLKVSKKGGKQTIEITGEAATELTGILVKGGAERSPAIDSIEVHSKSVRCSEMLVLHLASCTIEVR